MVAHKFRNLIAIMCLAAGAQFAACLNPQPDTQPSVNDGSEMQTPGGVSSETCDDNPQLSGCRGGGGAAPPGQNPNGAAGSGGDSMSAGGAAGSGGDEPDAGPGGMDAGPSSLSNTAPADGGDQ